MLLHASGVPSPLDYCAIIWAIHHKKGMARVEKVKKKKDILNVRMSFCSNIY